MPISFMRRTLLVILAALPLSSPAGAGPAEDAQAAFSKFFPAFVARNQAEVAAMFAPAARFYGTVAQDLVTGPDGVLKSFPVELDRPDTVKAPPLQMTSVAL